jgi:hypothetical protein
MARIYNGGGAGGSPNEGTCSTKPEQREWLQARPLTARPKHVASIGAEPTPLASHEVQTGAPTRNTDFSGKSQSALVALARLLARQAAAELSDEPAAASGDDAP